MMTLDDAIKHAEEVAEEKENEGKLLCQSEGASIGCLTCAEEHRQLAEWLKELKQLKAAGEDMEEKVIAEIDRQGEWLAEAGYNAYNVDIAFGSIIRALRKWLR